MTVLVGILAQEGVVIAADSAVTFGAGQIQTVSARGRKISIPCESRTVVAGTGNAGHIQRAVDAIDRSWKAKKFDLKWTGVQHGTHIARTCLEDFQGTGGGVQCGALVALWADGAPQLIEFPSTNFQPELKTKDIWYVAMGSGQLLADAYLNFISETVWARKQPEVEDAVFIAWWVMRHAIAAAPGFVAEPIDVAVLKKWSPKDSHATGRLLQQDELDLHINRAAEADESIRDALTRALMTPSAVAPPPSAPPAPQAPNTRSVGD